MTQNSGERELRRCPRCGGRMVKPAAPAAESAATKPASKGTIISSIKHGKPRT